MSGFSIDSAVLQREAKLAKALIGRRSKRILRCAKLAGNAGQATIAASDGQVTLTRRLDILAGEGDFVAAIPAEHLASIAKECPGTLAIKYGKLGEEPCVVLRHEQQTKATANVAAGVLASEFRLLVENLEAFPSTTALADSFRVLTVSAAELAEAIRWALPAGKDANYALVLRPEGLILTVGATNGYTLALYGGVKTQPVRQPTKPLVMALEVAERLLAVLEREAKADPEARLDLHFDEGSDALCFQGQGWHLNAAASGQFPDAAWDLLQREETTYAAIPSDAFKRGFKQASAAIKGEKGALVTIRVGVDGKVGLVAGDRIERQLPGAARGRAVELQVPVHRLKPWLANVPKNDWIGLCAVDPTQPIVFMCKSRPSATWTVAGQKAQEHKAKAPKAQKEAAAAA